MLHARTEFRHGPAAKYALLRRWSPDAAECRVCGQIDQPAVRGLEPVYDNAPHLKLNRDVSGKVRNQFFYAKLR